MQRQQTNDVALPSPLSKEFRVRKIDEFMLAAFVMVS
jgi:hypothetical protein